jgi:hypothetical protein
MFRASSVHLQEALHYFFLVAYSYSCWHVVCLWCFVVCLCVRVMCLCVCVRACARVCACGVCACVRCGVCVWCGVVCVFLKMKQHLAGK